MANLGAMIALAVYPIYPYKDVHLSVAAVDVVLAAGGIGSLLGALGSLSIALCCELEMSAMPSNCGLSANLLSAIAGADPIGRLR